VLMASEVCTTNTVRSNTAGSRCAVSSRRPVEIPERPRPINRWLVLVFVASSGEKNDYPS